jgi:hypothetical protein
MRQLRPAGGHVLRRLRPRPHPRTARHTPCIIAGHACPLRRTTGAPARWRGRARPAALPSPARPATRAARSPAARRTRRARLAHPRTRVGARHYEQDGPGARGHRESEGERPPRPRRSPTPAGRRSGEQDDQDDHGDDERDDGNRACVHETSPSRRARRAEATSPMGALYPRLRQPIPTPPLLRIATPARRATSLEATLVHHHCGGRVPRVSGSGGISRDHETPRAPPQLQRRLRKRSTRGTRPPPAPQRQTDRPKWRPV